MPSQQSQYDGIQVDVLRDRCGVRKLLVYDRVSSTQDLAHELAQEGVLPNICVLADAQSAGRGRSGKSWSSPSGSGIWFTLLQSGIAPPELDVLSLRIGMAVAAALEPFSSQPLQLKWPNDVYCGGLKLAGILVEARWHGERAEYVMVGVGVNVSAPEGQPLAAGLSPGVRRHQVLEAIVPRVRNAIEQRGTLTDAELIEFASRDWAKGKRCIEPVAGIVQGISSRGDLLVAQDLGQNVVAVRSGSLILE